MRRTSHQTTVLLATILERSTQKRARVSAKTIKVLAARKNLRSAFVREIIDHLAEFDWALFEMPNGGFGAVHIPAIEAAKSVTAARHLDEEERRSLRNGTLDFRGLEERLTDEGDTAAADE